MISTNKFYLNYFQYIEIISVPVIPSFVKIPYKKDLKT
jgi:hypothetical protein